MFQRNETRAPTALPKEHVQEPANRPVHDLQGAKARGPDLLVITGRVPAQHKPDGVRQQAQ